MTETLSLQNVQGLSFLNIIDTRISKDKIVTLCVETSTYSSCRAYVVYGVVVEFIEATTPKEALRSRFEKLSEAVEEFNNHLL